MADDIADDIVVELYGEYSTLESVQRFWSKLDTVGISPDGTLRMSAVPAFTIPELGIRHIAWPGQNAEQADYRIISKLGEGGMGVVYEAWQKTLDRVVALKIVKSESMHNPVLRNSFYYEAVITAGLEHPGIITTLDLGITPEGRALYAMKKVAGTPWSKKISQMSFEENLSIFEQVCGVVAYAHAHKVIHRDLKPGNILIGEFDEVWVADWGLAVRENAGGDFCDALPGGTPQYMAPEMARCENHLLGFRSDIYLLGGILFQMLTGLPPHPAPTTSLSLESAANNTIPSADIAGGLGAVIRKALTTNPDERYGTVNELRSAVREASLRHECERLCLDAESVLRKAIEQNNYRCFDQAITLYENALAVSPDSATAAVGKVQAALAYSRTALAKAEYDLASTIIAPLIPKSDAAAILSETIVREKRAAQARKRRNRILLGMLTSLIIFGGFFVGRHYWQTRKEFEVVSHKVAGASQFYESIHYNNQLILLEMDMPGGGNYFRFSAPDIDYPRLFLTKEQQIEEDIKKEQRRLKREKEKRQDEKEKEVMDALKKLLSPVRALTKIRDSITKEKLDNVARAIILIEPQLREEINKIKMMGESEALHPGVAKQIAEINERLLKKANDILTEAPQ